MSNKAEKHRPVNLIALARNFLHQSFLYLDRTEKLMRLFVGVFPVFLTWIIINEVSYLNLLGSLLIVHLLNWILNSNFWAVITHSIWILRNPGEKKTLEYLVRMKKRLERVAEIEGVLLFGSVSRGEWHDRSDLDIRFLRKPGIYSGVVGYLIIMRERLIAFIEKQPLDSYLADGTLFLERMRKDENPIFLKISGSNLKSMYPDRQVANIKSAASINQIAYEDS